MSSRACLICSSPRALASCSSSLSCLMILVADWPPEDLGLRIVANSGPWFHCLSSSIVTFRARIQNSYELTICSVYFAVKTTQRSMCCWPTESPVKDAGREAGVSSVIVAVHGHASRLSMVCCCWAVSVEGAGAWRCIEGRGAESSSGALRFRSPIATQGSQIGRACGLCKLRLGQSGFSEGIRMLE